MAISPDVIRFRAGLARALSASPGAPVPAHSSDRLIAQWRLPGSPGPLSLRPILLPE